MKELNKKPIILSEPIWRWILIVVSVLFILWIVLFGVSLLNSHEETFTVTKNDAATSCSTRILRFGPRLRSDAPKKPLGHYCGLIFTDRGYYLLPETGFNYFFTDNRKELDNQLQPGCKVKAKITGPGEPFSHARKQRVPVRQYISKILSIHSCPKI